MSCGVGASGRWLACHAPSRALVPDAFFGVLPFANRSPDKEKAFFTDGVNADILAIN